MVCLIVGVGNLAAKWGSLVYVCLSMCLSHGWMCIQTKVTVAEVEGESRPACLWECCAFALGSRPWIVFVTQSSWVMRRHRFSSLRVEVGCLAFGIQPLSALCSSSVQPFNTLQGAACPAVGRAHSRLAKTWNIREHDTEATAGPMIQARDCGTVQGNRTIRKGETSASVSWRPSTLPGPAPRTRTTSKANNICKSAKQTRRYPRDPI